MGKDSMAAAQSMDSMVLLCKDTPNGLLESLWLGEFEAGVGKYVVAL